MVIVLISIILPLLITRTSLSRLASSCLSLLVLICLLWITEPIPSYVTSLLIVPLSRYLRIIEGDLDGKLISSSFFDPVIFMFISGFTMAHVLDKYKIVLKISSPLIRIMISFQSLPVWGDFLLYTSLSLLCIIVSGVVSNVAACVLLTAMTKSFHSPRILLTIAYSCNIGGMIVPIASPQNIIALSILAGIEESMSFIEWLMFSGPVCALCVLVVYGVLRFRFGKDRYTLMFEEYEEEKGGWTVKQFVVIGIVVITIIGWIFFDKFGLNDCFGHMGVFGLISVIIFHGVGLLCVTDWNNELPWSVLTLLGGGIALGKTVQESGLLDSIGQGILSYSINHGSSVWIVYILFLGIVGIVSNFLSSTVCALIVLPLIGVIGKEFGHCQLFIVACAIMTSGAMGLPVSSFPNANAASVDNGKLGIRDFVMTGFPVAICIFAILASGGFVYGCLIF